MSDDRRLPYMKWFGADARRDTQLLECSLPTRAFWLLALTLMHEAEPYGHLLLSSQKPDEKSLAKQLGMTLKQCRKAIAEVIEKKVCSVTADGVIYSRRMVRDRAKFLEASGFGRKSALLRFPRPVDAPNTETSRGTSKASFQGPSQPRGQRLDTRSQRDQYSQGSVPHTPTAGPAVQKHIRPRVPPFIHTEFLQKLGDGDNPSDLIAFYERVTAEWTGRAIGDDDPKFWRARFSEWKGSTVKPTTKPIGRSMTSDGSIAALQQFAQRRVSND
jgi:hypothetical protein